MTTKRTKQITDRCLKLDGNIVVQAGQSLFALEDDTNSFVEYTCMITGHIKQTARASLLVERSLPSLANFEDKHIFVTGGCKPNSKGSAAQLYNSVERYDMEQDAFSWCPSMNVRRTKHSSCTLYKKLYVFCGWTQEGLTDSIEQLDAKALTRGKQVHWVQI